MARQGWGNVSRKVEAQVIDSLRIRSITSMQSTKSRVEPNNLCSNTNSSRTQTQKAWWTDSCKKRSAHSTKHSWLSRWYRQQKIDRKLSLHKSNRFQIMHSSHHSSRHWRRISRAWMKSVQPTKAMLEVNRKRRSSVSYSSSKQKETY